MQTLKDLVERLPRWVIAVIAVACVVIGTVLTMRPFTSVEVLVTFAGASAVLTGVLALAGRESRSWMQRWLIGTGWVVLGVAILAWPGLSVDALAVVVGVGLVVHGFVDVFGALNGRVRDERAATLVGGLAAVVFGVLALAWPDATVFVVAVLFGARTVMYGVSQLLAALRPAAVAELGPAPARSWLRRGVRLAGNASALLVAVGLLAVSAALRDGGGTISAFYDTPDEIPTTPGVLLRTEPFHDGIPDGAQGWLILHSTQTTHGDPTVATAVVMAPSAPSDGPRPVVAWTHGTVGIDRPCAPSLTGNPFLGLPIESVLANGWVMVATDYAGMGTEGVSPYLIGPGQARSALDSIRAAHQMAELDLSDDAVVWGHSQGGHAALWTGILADSYAPELTIEGVAALSPATDLLAMATAIQGELGGALASAYVLTAYSGTYADVDFDDYVRPGARVEVREAAKRCLVDPALLVSIITALPASQSVFAADPTTGAAGARLTDNIPTGAITAPLLVAHGTGDEVIPFQLTEDWVAARCAAGQQLEFVSLPDRTHMGVFEPESGLPDKLITWTGERFVGAPDTPTC